MVPILSPLKDEIYVFAEVAIWCLTPCLRRVQETDLRRIYFGFLSLLGGGSDSLTLNLSANLAVRNETQLVLRE